MGETDRIAGAIIAGGQSSRMQAGGLAGDKFLQQLGSQTIIEHVAARLSLQVDYLFSMQMAITIGYPGWIFT